MLSFCLGGDGDSRLNYFNARWYDADTGRFITEDPVRDGLLLYAYCNNNPMTFIDPTGMWRTRAERKQDKADRAREDGNTEKADRLEKQAEEARKQQERVEQLPAGYSGINGLSRHGEANNYPASPSINELLTDDTLTEDEKQKLLGEIAQNSTLMNMGAEALDELVISPAVIGVGGKAAGKVATLATVGTMYYDYSNLKTAIQVGDPIQIIDSSASPVTSAVGLINPMAGVVSDVYAEATVQAIEAAADVNMYAKTDPIGFIGSLNSMFGSNYIPPWSNY